jgi:transposase
LRLPLVAVRAFAHRPPVEVHLNLAYRWFCRLGLDGDVPDHSTFSKNRHRRFRESDLLRKLFETIFRL